MFHKESKNIPEWVAGDGTLLKELFHPLNENISTSYSLAEARIPAGGQSVPHRLTGSELYYFLSGEAVIFVNDEMKSVQKGDLVWVPPHAIQYVVNQADVDLVFICIVDPYWKKEDEILE